MIGRTLGHYRLDEKLGEGGMGVVYRARDLHLDRTVAIKVLHPDAVTDPERRRRFVQEAKAASALQHPNIITIYDIDTADGVDFIAMEYVAGQTLDRRVGHKGLPLQEALRDGMEIAAALAAAHEAGIVHRDIKPANLIVSDKGQVKVLDFGLAKLTERDPADPETATQTQEGAILGTVAYMSPEQAQGLKVDSRSDVFSFGAVLYEVVTGRRAFQGETKVSTLSAILREEPPPVSELAPAVPRAFERLIDHCLRKDSSRRLQNMGDVKTLLEDLLADSETRRPAVGPRPRLWRWAIAAVLPAHLGSPP